MEQIRTRLAEIGLNPDIHGPNIARSVVAFELTGDAVTAVRRVDPPADGQEPGPEHRVHPGDEAAVTETTVVFTTASGLTWPYHPGAARKGPRLNPA